MDNLPCEIQDKIYNFKHQLEFKNVLNQLKMKFVLNELMMRWDNGWYEGRYDYLRFPDDIY